MNWGRTLGGAGSGAMTGASIGSVIPGIGTGIGAAIGGGLGLLNSFLNNPEDAAKKGVNQGWQEAQNYQRPFWQQGQDQYGALNQARQDLMDPTKLQNQWAQSYETSPYAKRMLEMNNQQGQEAAAAMGLGGSSAAISNVQQGAGDIVSKDRQQYMNDLMQKYMSGIGIGQDIYGKGAQAGANLGQQAYGHGENLANIGYASESAPGEALGQGAAMLYNANKKPPTYNFYGGGQPNSYN